MLYMLQMSFVGRLKSHRNPVRHNHALGCPTIQIWPIYSSWVVLIAITH